MSTGSDAFRAKHAVPSAGELAASAAQATKSANRVTVLPERSAVSSAEATSSSDWHASSAEHAAVFVARHAARAGQWSLRADQPGKMPEHADASADGCAVSPEHEDSCPDQDAESSVRRARSAWRGVISAEQRAASKVAVLRRRNGVFGQLTTMQSLRNARQFNVAGC
jgi:hypothetical protein